MKAVVGTSLIAVMYISGFTFTCRFIATILDSSSNSLRQVHRSYQRQLCCVKKRNVDRLPILYINVGHWCMDHRTFLPGPFRFRPISLSVVTLYVSNVPARSAFDPAQFQPVAETSCLIYRPTSIVTRHS